MAKMREFVGKKFSNRKSRVFIGGIFYDDTPLTGKYRFI